MRIKDLLLLHLVILPLLAFAQPDMSVWKVDHKSNVPIIPHVSNIGDELWACGYDYYFDYPGDNVDHEVILHVLNEGTDTLEVNSSVLTNGSQGYEIDLLGLTGTIKIAPNHDLQVIVKFNASTYSGQTDQLTISSNDPNSSSCELSFEVGVTIGTSDTSDPCSCDNIINAANSFGYLFRDTLVLSSMMGNVNWSLMTNNNLNGFLDMTGTPIMPPLSFGSTNNSTIKYVFYRLPDEVVDIEFGGYQSPYVSPSSCAATCILPSAIPTISQWGIIILLMMLMCIGIVAIQSRAKLVEDNL